MRCSFGHFQLDTAERRLLRDGQPVSLTPKAFDTLLALVQHAGHAVSKDDLMHAVWPDGFVEETNLAFNISTLRKVLGDGQNGERYIETVPKLGYRFVMPVKMDSPAHHGIAYTKRSNLPAHLTRFIGRVDEIAEVTSLVQKRRLVTLTGSGGVGKTRLALEAGGQLLAHFADGVWLAEFAPLIDETLVSATVAGVFGLQEQPRRSPLDMLAASIGEKHMLLVFDNCEHVIDAGAKLAETLLQACPNLRILATSREALRVAGEAVWRVPSLSIPDMERLPSLVQALNFDAVHLFIEHAALAQAGFVLTPENLKTVVSICRRLDGIPLAIEMAAAQVDGLDVKQIESELAHRFDLLASGSRTAVPRHQTLRATLDWSYNLLSEPERALLTRLSVFRGGFTADAARHVCGIPPHTLLQLVRKSLVVTVAGEDDVPPQFRMLETIQLYAHERLLERESAEDVQVSHLLYFLNLAEEPIELAGPRVDPWVQWMDVEFDNIRVAFERAMQRNDHAELAMRLVRAMTKYGYHRGHMAELKSWAERAWEQGQNASIFARARGKMALASTYVMSGAKPLGIRYCEEALSLFRQSNDRLGLVECLEVLANNSFDEHVQAYAEEALTLSREIGAVDMESRALRALGVAALLSGDRAKAANYFLQAIQMAEWDIELCLEFMYEADSQRALAWCAGKRACFNSSTDPALATSIMLNYGVLLLMERNESEARLVIEQGIRIFEQVGKRKTLDLELMLQPLPLDVSTLGLKNCFCFLGLGLAELFLQNFAKAQTLLWQAGVSSRQAGIIWLEAIAELLEAHAKMLAGDHANNHLSSARERMMRFKRVGEPLGITCAMIQYAGLMSQTSDVDKLRLSSQLLGTASSCMPVDQGARFFGSKYLRIWLQDVEASFIEPALAAARAALGDAGFERCYAAGQRMSLDEAVALALNG